MKTIELTDEQYKALQAGEDVVIRRPRKWEPRGGGYFIASYGDIIEAPSQKGRRKFGMEYPTLKLAEKALAYMRRRNPLLAYVLEHAPEHDVSCPGFCVYKGSVKYSYVHETLPNLAEISMPIDVAIELCEKLNSGEVVL